MMFRTAEEYRKETDEWIETLPDRCFNMDITYIELGIKDKSKAGLYNLLVPIKKLNSKHIPSNIDKIKKDLLNRGFEVSDYTIRKEIYGLNKIYETKCILITWDGKDRTYVKTISNHIEDIMIGGDFD